ncbi:MAG: hypothetical protein A2020_08375 [Lentisphaerae bacterium GWF2_45_14]|nr:MAG: hypothetical protein A2020_08375 [Lentisphaerae bacterium GWF2_45_14]
MGLFAFFILSGASYAAGNLLIAAAAPLSIFYEKKLFKALVRVFLIVGLIFVMFSPASMSKAISAILILSVFSLFFALQLGAVKMGFTHIVRIIMALCALLAFWQELKYWKSPSISFVPEKIFVLGGSLSSAEEKLKLKPWPEIFKENSKLNVLNYSVPGALASHYVEKAEVVYGDNILVIIECGADDIKMKTPPPEFRKSLESLMAKIARTGRMILIFEIPEYPDTRGAYSKIIRETAAKFGAQIIPRRLIAKIIYEHQKESLALDQEGNLKIANLIKSFIAENMNNSNKSHENK